MTPIQKILSTISHCTLINRLRRRDQDLMFSWPVSSFFVIIHVNVWMSDRHNSSIALMIAMCDMIQFVVVVPVPDESSVILASRFM